MAGNNSAKSGSAARPGTEMPPPSVEKLVGMLASFCDGAKKRDGYGFNKGDSQDGRRLAAMSKRGLPWSKGDAERAKQLIGRYARQAATGWASGDRRAAARIERAIREDAIGMDGEPVEHDVLFNYVCLSPGGKKAQFCFLACPQSYVEIIEDIKAIGTLRHGARRVRVVFEKSVAMSYNGGRRRIKRWQVTFNGTTRPHILAAAEKWGFAIDPGLEADPDPVLDRLVMHPKALYLHEGVRDGECGRWFVFDLEQKDDAFTQTVKAVLPGAYVCDPSDDWNWFVPVVPRTCPQVARIASHFRFAVHPDAAALLAPRARG